MKRLEPLLRPLRRHAGPQRARGHDDAQRHARVAMNLLPPVWRTKRVAVLLAAGLLLMFALLLLFMLIVIGHAPLGDG